MPAEFFHSGKKPITQADQRRGFNPRDQFGRKWLAQIELASGDLCEVLPAGWSDPLRTPVKFIRMARVEGQTDMSKLVVDTATWRMVVEQDERVWYDQLIQNALLKNVDITDLAELERHKILLGLTGPKPFPSSEILKAADEGDQQYLGIAPLDAEHRAKLGLSTLADLKAPRAAPVAVPPVDDSQPPEKYQDFVSWAQRTGRVQPGDLKHIGQLWKQHRDSLQAA